MSNRLDDGFVVVRIVMARGKERRTYWSTRTGRWSEREHATVLSYREATRLATRVGLNPVGVVTVDRAS